MKLDLLIIYLSLLLLLMLQPEALTTVAMLANYLIDDIICIFALAAASVSSSYLAETASTDRLITVSYDTLASVSRQCGHGKISNEHLSANYVIATRHDNNSHQSNCFANVSLVMQHQIPMHVPTPRKSLKQHKRLFPLSWTSPHSQGSHQR